MPEHTWIINASPLILLGKINQLNLLKQLNPHLMVPEAVFRELDAGNTDLSKKRTLVWAQDLVLEDIPVPDSILKWDIGAGESQVLAQALVIKNSRAILDDGYARAAAQSHGIDQLGTLGVILRAKQAGFVDAAKPILEQLIANGSWLSEKLVREALRRVNEG